MLSENSEQLRQDLEALHGSLEEGWMCMDDTGDDAATRSYGVAATEHDWSHGCLYHQIFKIAVGKPVYVGMSVSDTESNRMDAMVTALGFYPVEECGSGYWTMYDWNDDPKRTWTDVQERVKEAIGRL